MWMWPLKEFMGFFSCVRICFRFTFLFNAFFPVCRAKHHFYVMLLLVSFNLLKYSSTYSTHMISLCWIQFVFIVPFLRNYIHRKNIFGEQIHYQRESKENVVTRVKSSWKNGWSLLLLLLLKSRRTYVFSQKKLW